MKNRMIAFVELVVMVSGVQGCLSYSHYRYSQRAEAAQALPEGVQAKPGRIYFVSFPENKIAPSIFGWHPTVGHAALVTNDGHGDIKQYDYGWFAGGQSAKYVIGYPGDSDCYGAVQMRTFSTNEVSVATNDLGVASLVLARMSRSADAEFGYGNKVEIWARDVDDIGIAERYMENFANDRDRGSMVWRCWQIGGYRCGNITRQAFDACRGEGHFLDLLWGGFPGADAPSIGTEKTVYARKRD